jgi:hypothetical protein
VSALGRNWCGDNVRELIGEAIRQKSKWRDLLNSRLNAETGQVDFTSLSLKERHHSLTLPYVFWRDNLEDQNHRYHQSRKYAQDSSEQQ